MESETKSISSLWKVRLPNEWPHCPEFMSVSLIHEIEQCPRKWALKAANYPEIWNKKGFPPSPHISAVRGQVLHLAGQKIIKALATANCGSVNSPKAISVIKELGGFTKIVQLALKIILSSFEDNPRLKSRFPKLSLDLEAELPEFRRKVQFFFSRLKVVSNFQRKREKMPYSSNRFPLGLGSYPEVDLQAPDINWKGVADLINVEENGVEIVDFKFGEESEKHIFQILTYAILWLNDKDRNPDKKKVDRLNISYPQKERGVPIPNEKEFDDIKFELIKRRTNGIKTLTKIPPKAKPDKDVCPYCDVRQNCNEYWYDFLMGPTISNEKTNFYDFQVKIISKHGPMSWDGEVEISDFLQPGTSILIRTNSTEKTINQILERGNKIRLLNTLIAVPSSDDNTSPYIVTLTSASEAFFVS